MESNPIDLRSDTVTRPTTEMRSSNLHCEYGDDVYEEDPTVFKLESEVANFFGKEKALFFPSGTMANLTALLIWCEKRGSEVIVGNKNHIFLFEQAGAAQFGGISYSVVDNNEDGIMELFDIEKVIREEDIHEPITALIAIENTHNACGGKILPISYLMDLRELSNKYNLPVHMDGARLWNALQEYKEEPKDIVKNVDSLSVCLSKGLGAPIGSLLLGTEKFINKSRRIRKALGGGMRQTGFIASVGLIALDDFKKGILKKDHERTYKIAKEIKSFTNFKLETNVQTNILFFRINCYSYSDNYSDSGILNFFKKHNILISLWDKNLFRIVFHRDITDENIDYIMGVFKKLNLLLQN